MNLEPPPLPDLSTLSRSQLESMVLQMHAGMSLAARMVEKNERGLRELEKKMAALETARSLSGGHEHG